MLVRNDKQDREKYITNDFGANIRYGKIEMENIIRASPIMKKRITNV